MRAKARAQALQAARHKPVYKDKRARIEAAIAELEPLPGTAKYVKKLKTLVDEAAKLLPDYEAAYNALEGLTKNLEEGRKAAREFPQKAGDEDCRKLLADARDALDKWEEIAGLAQADLIAEQRKIINEVLKGLDSDQPDLGLIKKNLRAVENEAKVKAGAFQTKLNEANQAAGSAEKLVKKAFDVLPPSASAPIQAAALAARALLNSQMPKEAEQAFSDLESTAGAALKQKADPNDERDLQAYFNEWEKIGGDKGTLATEVDPLIKRVLNPGPRAAGFASLESIANPIQTAVARARAFAGRRQFKEAVEIVGKLKPDCERLKTAADHLEAGNGLESLNLQFANPNFELNLHFEKARQLVRDAAEAVEASIRALDEAGGDTYSHNKELNALRNPWGGSVAAFVDANKAPVEQFRTLDAARNDTVTKLATLKTAVSQIRGDQKQLAVSQDLRKKGGGEKDFDKTRQAAESARAELMALHAANRPEFQKAPAPADLKADFDELLRQAAAGQFAIPNMQRISEIYKDKIGFLKIALKTRVEAGQAKAKQLKETIAGLEKENEKYKPFFDTQSNGIDEALAGLTKANFETLDSAENALSDLETSIKKLADDLRKGPVNFKGAETKLKQLEKRVDSDVMKKYQPAAQAALATRLEKELPDVLHQLDPPAVNTRLESFEKQVKTIEDLADEAKDLRENELPSRVKSVKAELDAEVKKNTPTLYASLEKRINAAEAAPKGAEKAAVVELDAIQRIILAAKDTKKAPVLEKKAKLDAFEAERAQQAFLASKDVFEKNAKRQADAVNKATPSGELNENLYKQIDIVFDEAKELAKQQRYPEANLSLSRAVALANSFIANPTDHKNGAREELARLNKSWKEAVAAFVRGVQELQATIRSAENYPSDVQKAADTLNPLYQVFDAAVFDEQVKELSGPQLPQNLAKDRTRKEDALFYVQLYRQQLASNLLLNHVIGNPIKPVAVGKLRSALTGLDAGFRAA